MPRLPPDEAALLRAVCAHPADDLPRLVYADWLDEHGRSDRAEFIRVQCELADPRTPGRRRTELLYQARALFADHAAAAWRRELPRWAGEAYSGTGRPDYRRGFAVHLTLAASPFARFGGDLLDRVPLEAVTLAHAGPLAARLGAAGWLGRVPDVDVSGTDLSRGRAGALAAGLAGVVKLTLDWCDVGDAGARALGQSAALSGLKRLSLRGNGLSPLGVAALAESVPLRGLEALDLAGNPRVAADAHRVRRLFTGRPVVVTQDDPD